MGHAATFDFGAIAGGGGFTDTNDAARGGGEADWNTRVGAGIGIKDVGSGISVIGSGLSSTGDAVEAYFDNNPGLGVCGVVDGNGQCVPGNDDNVGAYGGSENAGDGTFETLVLTFSTAVDLTNLLFKAEGHGLFTGDLKINGAVTSILNGAWAGSLIGTVFSFEYIPVPEGTPDMATNEFYLGAAVVDRAPPPGPNPVPLPAGLPLLAAGLGAFGLMRRRKG
jgi:hypothetical protein